MLAQTLPHICLKLLVLSDVQGKGKLVWLVLSSCLAYYMHIFNELMNID